MNLQLTLRKMLIPACVLGFASTSDAQALLVASANGSSQSINLSELESIVFTNNNLVVHHSDCEDAYFSVFFTDYATLDGSVRVAENASSTSEVKVYPNPAIDQITLETSSFENAEVSIWNAQGSLVQRSRMNGRMHRMDIADLPSGLYLIRVNNQTISFVKP